MPYMCIYVIHVYIYCICLYMHGHSHTFIHVHISMYVYVHCKIILYHIAELCNFYMAFLWSVKSAKVSFNVPGFHYLPQGSSLWETVDPLCWVSCDWVVSSHQRCTQQELSWNPASWHESWTTCRNWVLELSVCWSWISWRPGTCTCTSLTKY